MTARRAVATATALLLLLPACSGASPDLEPIDDEVQAPAITTADGLTGPLCPVLPKGDEPGNPTFLRDLDMAEALTWNPILTVAESLGRASGIDEDLGAATDVTYLVPSDDTLNGALEEHTIDALIFERTDETAALLNAHIVDGAMSLTDLVDAGEVTTRAGTTVLIDGTHTAPRFGEDDAELLCGDYVTAGGRIHVIGGVLAPLPPEEPGDELDLDDDAA